jgi:hypothetical protein
MKGSRCPLATPNEWEAGVRPVEARLSWLRASEPVSPPFYLNVYMVVLEGPILVSSSVARQVAVSPNSRRSPISDPWPAIPLAKCFHVQPDESRSRADSFMADYAPEEPFRAHESGPPRGSG